MTSRRLFGWIDEDRLGSVLAPGEPPERLADLPASVAEGWQDVWVRLADVEALAAEQE